MEVLPRKCASWVKGKPIQLYPAVERHLPKREADVVQWGVHIRNQDVLCADGALTALDHSQGVGEYLEGRKNTQGLVQ